jgi:hypothetical protein
LHVGSVDCTDKNSKPICSQFKIGGYPTLIYFPPAPFLFNAEIPEDFQAYGFVFDGKRKVKDWKKFAL